MYFLVIAYCLSILYITGPESTKQNQLERAKGGKPVCLLISHLGQLQKIFGEKKKSVFVSPIL